MEGQIVLDRLDHFLWQSNLFGWCGASSGHCLGFFRLLVHFPTAFSCSTWWSMLRMRNWLVGGTQRVLANSSFWNWQPVKSVVLQGLMLGPVPFNAFINDLDDGIKGTLRKFPTKLTRKVNVSEGRVTLQQDLDRLGNWMHKNIMNFSKDKCKVLHLRIHSPGVQHRLEPSWLGSSSMKKDLEVRVDSKLSTSEQGAAVAKEAKRILSSSTRASPQQRERRHYHILLSSCQAKSGILCPVLVPAILKRCRPAWEGQEKDHIDDQRTGKPVCHVRKGWENCVYSA